MKKYSILFAIAYFTLSYALGEIAERMQINAGVSFNITATIASAFIAAWWFGRQQRRRPTPQELNAFSWQGLVGVWLASIVLTIIVFTFFISSAEVTDLLSQLGMGVIIIGGLIAVPLISLLYYFVIRLSFSWMTKLQAP